MKKAISLSNYELITNELAFNKLQVTRLLDITMAINKNTKVPELIKLYESILKDDFDITRLAFILLDNDQWQCFSTIGFANVKITKTILETFTAYDKISVFSEPEQHPFHPFQIIIPIKHKDTPIAYVLLGDLEEDDNVFELVRFITTYFNIVAVAIENKRLFKRQLEQDRFKREIEMATAVQSMLIPDNKSLPSDTHIQLDGVYKPIWGIGGDYFDYLPCNNPDEIAFCIADISGKGMAAALLMSNFQASLYHIFKQDEELITCVNQQNKAMLRISKKEKFITFFIAKYNKKNRFLQYINAGHNPSVLVCGNDVIELDKGCTILGAFDELPSIELGVVNLCEEALIVNYTDGITDISNPNGEYFDITKLKNFSLENKSMKACEFNQALMATIDTFKEDRLYPDDIALLTCKIH